LAGFPLLDGAQNHTSGGALLRAILLAAIALVCIFPISGGTSALADPSPLGIALEGYPYPYPVQFLPLGHNGEAVRMAYMDVAPTERENGRAVLLLHGHNFPSSYWAPVIESLTAAGDRVIVPDQIGFNKSSKPLGPWSFDTAAAETAALLDSLHLNEVDVVGHSMGGMLAMRFTRTYPERVRHLVLEAPLGLEDYRLYVPPEPHAKRVHAAMSMSAEEYYERLQSSYHMTLSHADVWPFVELRERLKGSAEFPRWVESDVASEEAIWSQTLVPELPLITRPVLFIVGKRDRTAPGKPLARPEDQERMGHVADLARTLAPSLRDARVVELVTGHLVHLEATEAFNRALLEFLQ
jgi:pimeloyl-ACP methyl ester carboxylesterase